MTTTFSSAASCISVLRFASTKDSEESLILLRKRIVDHFARTTNKEETQATANNDKLQQHAEQPQLIAISNRYFSAHVSLELEDSCSSSSAVVKEDGMVLVLDAGHTTDFSTLEPIHERAEAAGGGDLLRLCVALGTSTDSNRMLTPKQQEEDYAKRILWCLDRGYEYICVTDLSESAVLQGHDCRDKDGFARVVEAIQGTVWSSAVMTPKPKPPRQQSSSAGTRAANGEQPPSADENAYQPPDPSLLLHTSLPLTTTLGPSSKEDQIREERARHALLEAENKNDDPSSSLQQQQQHVDERLFNEFEGAIREAARIRDISHSGQLSDDERRQRAGDAAMTLMNLLQQMGYDEEDEQQEEDDSNGGDDEPEMVEVE